MMPTSNPSKPLSIVITGATSGIGLQLAMDYLSQGHDVYTVGRNSDVLHTLATMGAKTIQLDLTKYDAVMQAFNDIKTLDLFIAAAGICEYIDMPNFDSRSIMRVMNANYGSLVHVIEALLPALKATKGKIVTVGSASALVPFVRAEGYGSSKAAIHYLSKTLQMSLQPYGVKVALVVPGFVKTPMTLQNDFPMPFLQTVQQASQAIQQGIANDDNVIEFPQTLVQPLKLLAQLPDAVWHFVGSKLSHTT